MRLLCLSSILISMVSADRLFFLGDWGGTEKPPYTTKIQLSVAAAMLKYQKNHTSHVFAIGDNFYHTGVDTDHSTRFKNTWQNVYNPEQSKTPWHLLAGNHDYYGNVTAELDFKGWDFPTEFYTVKVRDSEASIKLVMVDTILLCGLTDEDENVHSKPSFSRMALLQLRQGLLSDDFDKLNREERLVLLRRQVYKLKRDSKTYWKWLDTELKKSKKYDYVFVLGHYPTWSIAEHGPTECLVKRMPNLLSKYDVTAYVAGHDHNMQLIHKDNNRYILSGAGNFMDSATTHMKIVGEENVLFHMNKKSDKGGMAFFDTVSKNLVFVDGHGKIRHQSALPKRKARNPVTRFRSQRRFRNWAPSHRDSKM